MKGPFWSQYKLSVFETHSRFYLVKSDAAGTRFSVLKVDRTEGRRLHVIDCCQLSSQQELNELLTRINNGNSFIQPAQSSFSSITSKIMGGQERKKFLSERSIDGGGGGLRERLSGCWGLLGFIRFLEGYYMLLITKATHLVDIGYHKIYKIEDTATLYIPNSDAALYNPDEEKLLKLFQSVDLGTNFYFSYTYDLSLTLQKLVTKTNQPTDMKFIWNRHLMTPWVKDRDSVEISTSLEDWVIPVIHGYIGHTNIRLPSTRIELILIGRRSSFYAGTRFMKRGSNSDGHVANEVETEMILWDSSSSASWDHGGKYTSFVQCRGSVPLIWSQQGPVMVRTKPPPINIDLPDPYATVSGRHFKEMREKYGDPIIVINLVKSREKRIHEFVLHEQFVQAVSYLNQFLSPEESILYLSFDMARCNKLKPVLPKLEEIGLNVIPRHGWFQTFPKLHCHEACPNVALSDEHEVIPSYEGDWIVQVGVPRTNCVDCLDRTNVAQFAIAKVALAHQLYAMGLLSEPNLDPQASVCHILEELFEDHGDTLALQYAGSQLVHSIKTYKKTAVFYERSRDVIQTISRYYSNTFADYDKQNAINLLLGVYTAYQESSALGNMISDKTKINSDGHHREYCAWFEEESQNQSKRKNRKTLSDNELFQNYYRTFELTSFDALIPTLNLSKCPTLYSLSASMAEASNPKPDRKPSNSGLIKQKQSENREDDSSSSSDEDESPAAAKIADVEVIYSTGWQTESLESSTAGKLRINRSVEQPSSQSNYRKPLSSDNNNRILSIGLTTTQEAYGFQLRTPSKADLAKYEKYSQMGGIKLTDEDLRWMKKERRLVLGADSLSGQIQPSSFFTSDSAFGCALPTVSQSAYLKYRETIECALKGPKEPSPEDMLIYQRYVGYS